MRRLMMCAVCVIALMIAGCSPARLDPDRMHTQGLDRADAYVGGIDEAMGGHRAPMTIDGEAVTWGELVPLLAEASGGEVMREIALDRMLERECAKRGIDVREAASPGAMARERELLGRALLGEGVANDPDEVARLLVQVRQARGLGERRFAGLLRRSALLRRLVRDDVEISEDALHAMYDLRYGPKRHVRLIVTHTLAAAQAAAARVRHGEAFSRVALEDSIDLSAAAGGVVGAMSRADPAWPRGLREAAFAQRIGTFSAPIAVETGYAIMAIDREVAPTSPGFAHVRGELEAALRIREERRLSDRLARRLLGAANVKSHDPALLWSWWALVGGTDGSPGR